jgi:hypothetical protein
LCPQSGSRAIYAARVANEREQRRARLHERLRDQRAKRTRPEVLAHLLEVIGYSPSLDDFLAVEATERLIACSEPWWRAHDVQRRTWSNDLEREMHGVLVDLADDPPVTTSYWLPREWRIVGAVLVPVEPIVREAVRSFTSGSDDLWLLTHDGDSGLRLSWDHLPDRDEFELVTWGAWRSP